MGKTFKPWALPELERLPSPNSSRRVHGNDVVDLILVHTPEGSYSSALNTCLDPEADVSYHVLLDTDGRRGAQLVDWNLKAWHGKAFNSRSEGIALAGYARSTRALSPGGRALARAVAARLRARGLPPVWRRTGGVGGGFCRHADIQADRRDPMGLGRWLTFVALVKYEYRRGGFRDSWGFGTPNRIR
jgi:hypothetical protein